MGIIERKEKEKKHRRSDIIKAAKKVFFKYGFSNSSMDMIAGEAQLSKGTIYLYFKSKDDLYVTLLLDGMAILRKMFTENDLKSDSVEEILMDYAETYYDFSVKYPEFFNMILEVNTGDNIHIENIADETLKKIREEEEKMFLGRVKLLERGILSGEFNDTFSTCYVTTMLWAAISGAVILTNKNSNTRILENIKPKEFVRDIAKVFIIAYSKSAEKANIFRNQLLENACTQAPCSLHSIVFNKQEKETI